MNNVGAFFDIDGTIFRNSLMIEHFKKLTKYEVISPLVWHLEIKDVYKEWEQRYGDFEHYLETLASAYLEELKGVNRDYVSFIAKHVIEENGDMVYKYSRDRIKWHQDEGHYVFFISGSPDFLVSEMAKKYNVTEYRGSTYKVDNKNEFTGEIIPMWDSKSKSKALDELIKKYRINLDKSFAYGDTTGDLSMLKMMGNSIAINPNKELLNCIKSNDKLFTKSKIIVERKNVIYDLKPDVSTII